MPRGDSRTPDGGLLAYEWCVLRVVPRVERCEFVNAGAVVYSRSGDVLVAGVELDGDRALALDPRLDVTAVRRHLDVVAAVCAGTHPATAAMPPGARFRWLTAARSTVVQASPVHTGLSLDPASELSRLLDSMVRPLRD
ncbi:MAG: DUF3037 domain-containing protein [Actinomycetota bacterium]